MLKKTKSIWMKRELFSLYSEWDFIIEMNQAISRSMAYGSPVEKEWCLRQWPMTKKSGETLV